MNIKDLYKNIKQDEITDKFVDNIKKEKDKISVGEKKNLEKIIEKYKTNDIDDTLKAIKIYAIWEADKSILVARKKGAFRYKGYKLENNYALYLLDSLLKCNDIFEFSKETINYLKKKKQLSWLFDFYKQSEQQIIKHIKNRHKLRKRVKKDGQDYENALFKDLLVYIELNFYLNREVVDENYLNRNELSGYSNEAICEAASYIIYLYNDVVGIKQNCNYFANPKYILSGEIEKVILTACKSIEIQEWELCIDYFDYNINENNRTYTIEAKNDTLEKSIRSGYCKIEYQQEKFHYLLNNSSEQIVSIEEISNKVINKFSGDIMEKVNDSFMSRYRFKFPDMLLKLYSIEERKLFREEYILENYISKELIMSIEEAEQKKITKNCTLVDVILFQRLFIIINDIVTKLIFSNKDMSRNNMNTILNSLVISFKKEVLLNLINIYVKDINKTEELFELFSNKNGKKLDLQYTPFIEASGSILISNTIVAKSNLLRNSIAHSYAIKNEIVNDDQGLETLVKVCEDIFLKCTENYQVLTNKKFKYRGNKGEIDLIVVSKEDILLIECKCPLAPVNNFEMRSSFNHLYKANKQLNLSKSAFSDKSFRNNYLKTWGIKYNGQNIRTCILFGNRLFSGYNELKHPIRYIYELDTVLNQGTLSSVFGEWKFWNGDTFSHSDLIDFLSEDKSLCNLTLKSMVSVEKEMSILDKKIVFKTYAYNAIEAFKYCDSNFKIIKSNDSMKKEFLDKYDS